MLGLAASLAQAGEVKTVTLTYKDGKFQPETIKGPAGATFKLVVTNNDKVAEEFESHALNKEKIIAPGQTVTIHIGPLPAGSYPFFGEFHPNTAKGTLTLE